MADKLAKRAWNTNGAPGVYEADWEIALSNLVIFSPFSWERVKLKSGQVLGLSTGSLIVISVGLQPGERVATAPKGGIVALHKLRLGVGL